MSTKLTQKITSVVLSVATVAWLVGTSFVPAARAQTVTIESLLQQIAVLQAQLLALQGGAPAAGSCSFTSDLTVGSKGDAVTCLQNYLTSTGHFTYSGAKGTFGPITRSAVAAWQAANGVSPAAGYFGSRSRAKYNALVAVVQPPPPPPPACGGVGQPACTVVPTGTGLTVSAGTQIATGMLHPDNAVRVPYTALVFTASSDGDVKVNSLTVERRGASTDATFSGVVLLNQDGVQVGLEKTLNSNHQAIMNESFTIPAGQSRTYWIAANRTTGGSNGTQASFALVSVSSAATVNGTLPIVGTTRTMNVAGLGIGTADVATGPAKSVSTTTEDAGKTMIFTAVKVTAGSVEDVSLKSIRFNQVGTVGTSDITGLEVKVDGTVYPHTVSADGKYFTATFAGGITITKGNNKEITIGGTLSGGTNRTIKFDVYRMTDIAVDGKLFGYGINPTASTGFTSTNPVYFASQITVGKATLSVEKDPAVAAQNIAINLGDQPMGGFIVEAKGEPISVASLIFRLGIKNVSGGSDETGANVDQIKVIDASGKILAGPTDGVAATSGTDRNKVTFTDTVTFPIGKTYIKLLGKLDTAFDNNDTVSASTTPSSEWTTVTGVNTGETITPTPSSAVIANTMTVKGASLSLSVAPTPIAQTVVSGITGFTFANYTFDAQSSGEDLRMSSVPLAYATHDNGASAYSTATNLTNCQLYDGATSLTTGGNAVNPSGSSAASGSTASSTTFTFDGSGLVIPKGTAKTLKLKCNIAGGATGTFSWGIDSAASFSATGLTSGQSTTPVASDNNGQKMTLASSGSYTVTDDSTPGYRIVNAGATGVVLARLRLSALNEPVDLRQIRFQLTTVASNTPIDLVNSTVTLYDEAAPTVAIGTALFGSGGTIGADMATSTLPSGTLVIPQGGSKTILVKGDIAAITANGPLTASGDFLKVNYDGTLDGSSGGGNYGVGQSSGTEISPGSADTAVQGVRIMKGYPSFAKCTGSSSGCDAVPTNVLTVKSGMPLYRFKVTAVGGDVRIAKLTFQVSSTSGAGLTDTSSTATTTKYSLYAYLPNPTTGTGDFSAADTTFSSNGLLNANQCYVNGNQAEGRPVLNTVGLQDNSGQIMIYPDAGGTACGASAAGHSTTTYKIPAGVTRYFDFQADVASVESVTGTQSFAVSLLGDAAFPVAHQDGAGGADSGEMSRAVQGIAAQLGKQTVDDDTNNDFIWSPVSTTSSQSISDFDFTNGYQVPGIPTTNMPTETFTSQN